MRKQLIAFEGIEASGKSTQIKMLEERLKNESVDFTIASEPTDSLINKMIRRSFLSNDNAIDRTALDALFLADRINHIRSENGLLKQLEDNIVICDNYVVFGIAYSAYNFMVNDRMCMWQAINNAFDFNHVPLRLLVPDITVYLDIDAEESTRRLQTCNISELGTSANEIYKDIESIDTLHGIYDLILRRFKCMRKYGKHKILRFDGKRDPEWLSEHIWEALKNDFLFKETL